MLTASLPPIPAVIHQHAEEAAHLRHVRSVLVAAPHVKLAAFQSTTKFVGRDRRGHFATESMSRHRRSSPDQFKVFGREPCNPEYDSLDASGLVISVAADPANDDAAYHWLQRVFLAVCARVELVSGTAGFVTNFLDFETPRVSR